VKRARLWALIGLTLPALALARFDASVDSTSVSESDTIRLTLRADSANITSDPDFDALSAQFDVLSTQRSSQVRIINGQMDALTTWTLLLKPKHTGTLDIPAISLGNETSQPIQITVRDLDPQLKRAIAQTVFFETTYEPRQVYVQSQIVVTRRLYYVNGAQLYGDMPNVPDVPGAMVKSLGDADHTTTVRDGRQYGMIEQRFALFPERSGDLTVPPATVTGSVRLSSDGGMTGRRISVDVTSDALSIPVLPIPADYPRGVAWLPATDVELLEDWPGEPERGLETGTPSQRTLIVRAEGNAASAIPPLEMGLPDSLKAYPEPPKLSETQARAGIIGTRTESTSLVATRPGKLTLPEVHVTWFDVVNRQIKSASVPAHTITITGASTAAPPPKQDVRQESSPAEPEQSSRTRTPATATDVFALLTPMAYFWLAVAIAIALTGWAINTWRRRRHTRDVHVDPRKREAAAYRKLCRACDGGDPRTIRAALDDWLLHRYAAPLADAARRFGSNAEARAALDALNARLYRRDAADFDAKRLRRSVDAARAPAKRAPIADELPALYPSA
jgi:hypothetical protein